jgi:hypothetical protein
MDYEAMRQEGIDRTQQLSGDIWTDYNEHDPGITILENLCYALTELGYKTNLPVEDLLFGKGSEKFDPRDNAMFPAPEVLPCTPQTLLDYRKLIIDQILGVKNAWVIPLDRSELGINMNGLSQVYLQLDPSFRGEPAAVIAETRHLLAAHRNLGEDVDRIEILQSEKIAFQAEINLSANVVAESVLAEAFFRIGEMLTPQVRFHTLEDMLESGETWDHIFNCPLPRHGFIKDADLQRSELNLIGTIHKSLSREIPTPAGRQTTSHRDYAIAPQPLSRTGYADFVAFPGIPRCVSGDHCHRRTGLQPGLANGESDL